VKRYTNTASVAVLAADISSSATSVSLQNFSGWPGQVPFWAEIDRLTGSAEVVLVEAVAGSTLTIVRGQDGTVPAEHSTGAAFEHVIPAEVPNKVESHVAAASAHGASSPLVGRDDSVTLINKTYRGAHLHRYTDSNPVSPDSGFKVEANSNADRVGFRFNHTSASQDQVAVQVDQSGSPRLRAFADGTVDVDPNPSASRPGLRNRADTQLDGPVSIAGPTSAAAVTATSVNAGSVSGTTVSGAVQASTLAVDGVAVRPQTNPSVRRFDSSGSFSYSKPAGARWHRPAPSGRRLPPPPRPVFRRRGGHCSSW
jgi:hypothetical protein